MHLPEAVVGAGEFGGFSCWPCLRMNLGQWEVTVHVKQNVPKGFQQCVDDRICTPTVRTLVVAVFHQCHSGVRADYMVTWCNGYFQLCHALLPSSNSTLPALLKCPQRRDSRLSGSSSSNKSPRFHPTQKMHVRRRLPYRDTRHSVSRPRPWARNRRAAGSEGAGSASRRHGTTRCRPRFLESLPGAS